MEQDQLTPSGYFDDFSWHSVDEDDGRDAPSDPFEAMLVRAAPHELSDALREEAQPPRDSPDNRATR
jgi:hypothetical protein